jgi:hypothetical protein
MMFSEFFFMIPGVEIFFKHFEWLPALLTVPMILVFQIRCYRDKALKHTRRFFQLTFAFLLATLILIALMQILIALMQNLALMQTNYHSSVFQGKMWVCRSKATCAQIMSVECGKTPKDDCPAYQEGIKILLTRLKMFLQKHADNVKIIASMIKMDLISNPAIRAS